MNKIIFETEQIDIKGLIEQFGADKARLLLQNHFKRPESFYQFKQLFTGHILDEPPEFHDEMVGVVLYNLFRDRSLGTRFGFGAPRGFAKSTQFNLFFLAWCAVNGYFHFILQISDTHYQAKLLLGALKSELENNHMLHFIYPNLKGKTWGEETIVVNSLDGEVMILPLGAGMKVRGLKFKQYRPQLAIIDDLENLEAVYSSERRQKLQMWFDNDFEPAFDRYNKNIVYVGTILHYSSLLKQVLERQGKYKSWVTITYQALNEEGKSLWEKRFSADYLRSIRDDPNHPDYVGSIVFAQEYQNKPQDDKDRIIKLEWLKEYNFRLSYLNWKGDGEEAKMLNYLYENFEERVAGVDTAISEKDTGDSFSMYIYGLEHKTAHEKMLDCVHGKYPDINEQVRIICDNVETWKIDTLGIESVAFQKGLFNLVRTELNKRGIYYCRVIEIKTDKDKIRRARIHSSAFEGGFVYLRTDTQGYNIIRKEIEEFPLGAHDDAFDSWMLSREARQRPQVRVFEEKLEGF